VPRHPGNTRGTRWKGPPGLSPAQKKRWSEKQRQKNLTPAARAAQNKRRRKNWPAIAERRSARRFRFRPPIRLQLPGARIVTPQTLRRPPLMYIDAAGTLFREDFRSAEKLISDWKRLQKTRKRKGAP